MEKGARSAALRYQPLMSRTTLLLACVCALSVLLYSVFLLEAVAHAASQTSAQRKIKDISEQLGDLEGQYLSSSQALTLQRAQQLGYVVPSDTSTVFANAASPLSFRGQ